MNKGIKISVFITYILSSAFVLQVISVLITQHKLESNIENPSFHIGVLFGYLGNIFFFVSGLLSLIFEGKYFQKKIKILYVLLLFWIIIVFLRTGGNFFDPRDFTDIKGIAPYLGMSVLFTANLSRFRRIMKLMLWIGLALAVGGIINTLKLSGGFDRMMAQMQLRLIAVNLVWISPLVLFFNYKNYKILSWIIFGLSFIFSLLIVTRSFLIIHILVFLFFMRFVIKKKIGGFVLALIVAFTGLIFLAPQIGALENAINLLNERGSDDSRSMQIILFLDDIDFNDFLLGAGVRATWNWGSRDYPSLDNQVLLTAWWAGVIPIAIYLTMFIKPIYKSLLEKKINRQIKAVAFILFIWILALLGFGVYIGISATLYHFTICFILGFLFHLVKLKERLKNAV